MLAESQYISEFVLQKCLPVRKKKKEKTPQVDGTLYLPIMI